VSGDAPVRVDARAAAGRAYDMVETIATVWLPVTDMERALDFYEGTLGMDVEQRDGEWSMLKAGKVGIGLNARESPAGDGGAVVAFRADQEIQAAVDALAEKGVEVPGGVTEHPWGRVATFKDPDGNDLQYYEPPS
jgi:predicted enzyme related to lactoylglutathione lyase